jgi:hypothetical protein
MSPLSRDFTRGIAPALRRRTVPIAHLRDQEEDGGEAAQRQESHGAPRRVHGLASVPRRRPLSRVRGDPCADLTWVACVRLSDANF